MKNLNTVESLLTMTCGSPLSLLNGKFPWLLCWVCITNYFCQAEISTVNTQICCDSRRSLLVDFTVLLETVLEKKKKRRKNLTN